MLRGLTTAVFFLSVAPALAQEGRAAPGWGELRWVGGKGVRWEDLRGKVVLVRWWTGPGCHYCISTAPALREFHTAYGPRGLRVIGMFHPKPRPRPVGTAEAERLTREKGFEFPVAVDDDWAVLRRWWKVKGWTSVSFLVDKKGIVRHAHPGGEYHAAMGPHTASKEQRTCVAEYKAMRARIELLLSEE